MRLESRAISGYWIVVTMALLAAPVAHADLYTAVAAGSVSADPRRSLELLDAVKAHVDEDPSAFEIRAAASSQTGDFEGAIAAQKR